MTTGPSVDLLFVLGTRPEIIKLAPVIRELETRNTLSYRLLHTAQHYDKELSEVFFENLKLSPPDVSLDIGSGTQGEQTADGIRGVESEIDETEPSAVVALGDTNAVLSAALSTSKATPEFAHLEAGIRSFDREMPEEINRVLADQVSDLAFAPTERAVSNLASEGVSEGVHLVGNTIVDACMEHAAIAEKQTDIHERLELVPDQYAVATVHRPRNTDDLTRLETIVDSLDRQSFPVIFPVHPRTRDALRDIEFEQGQALVLTEPLDYLDFIALLDDARLVITDSGGIQEEASILEVPCLTVRPNTERPETVAAGVNELLEPGEIRTRAATVFADGATRKSMTGHPDLYGDGTAGEQIVEIMSHRYAD